MKKDANKSVVRGHVRVWERVRVTMVEMIV